MPIEEKESYRWLENVKEATGLFEELQRCVHIRDRESDYLSTVLDCTRGRPHFLLRTCVDRLASGRRRSYRRDEMKEVRVQGLHRIQVRNKEGEISEVVPEMRYRRIPVLPPIGKQRQYPELKLRVLHALERGTPKDRDKIDWKLITDLPVQSRADAIEKLESYAMRWKIAGSTKS